MQIISCIEDLSNVKDNIIIGLPSGMEKSKFNFRGTGNLLFLDDGIELYDTELNFLGDNSVCFLSRGSSSVKIKLDIYYNSVFYLGKNANTTRPIHVIISEEKHIFIGNDCLFSRDIWFRNGDPHLIYDCNTKKRSNQTKSIFLGDHVWIGQNVLISKGTKIGSGSAIGGWSMTAGKKIASNCIWGGCPIKLLKKNIFWLKPSVHSYRHEQTKASLVHKKETFIFGADKRQLPFETIDKELDAISSAEERYAYLKRIYDNGDKNRFFIARNRFSRLSRIRRKIKRAGRRIKTAWKK